MDEKIDYSKFPRKAFYKNDPTKLRLGYCEYCGKSATYNYEGKTSGIRCKSHSTSDMIDVRHKNLVLQICKQCNLKSICNLDGLCYDFCVANLNFQNNKKQNEKRVTKLLLNSISVKPTLIDEIVDSSCNYKRPDIVYNCGFYNVVLEIDEFQHKSYGCELNRMLLITQSLGLPTIFIRYNPDIFRDKDSKIVYVSLIEREKILLQWVQYLLKTPPNIENKEQYLRCVYLFYDNFDQTISNIENIKLPENFFDIKLTYDKKDIGKEENGIKIKEEDKNEIKYEDIIKINNNEIKIREEDEIKIREEEEFELLEKYYEEHYNVESDSENKTEDSEYEFEDDSNIEESDIEEEED